MVLVPCIKRDDDEGYETTTLVCDWAESEKTQRRHEEVRQRSHDLDCRWLMKVFSRRLKSQMMKDAVKFLCS